MGQGLRSDEPKAGTDQVQMLIKIVKLTAIGALVVSLLWRSSPDVTLTMQFAIAAAAVIVLVQAAIMHCYVWMTLFIVVACLFNPVVPLQLTNYLSGLAGGFALLLFFFSGELLKPRPRMSIASITDRMPGSQAL